MLFDTNLILIYVLISLAAILYSSVGHGGASGYLAILSIFSAVNQREMSSTALILNVLVSGIAFYAFYKSGYFSFKLLLPFIITSIPAAYIGGLIPISSSFFYTLLAFSLLIAAGRLFFKSSLQSHSELQSVVRWGPALAIGAVIGLISGMIGVGGGIFLSPLILFMRWGSPKETAAVSAAFIFINSFAGLAGRYSTGTLSFHSDYFLIGFALAGAIVGSKVGANVFSSMMLKRSLAIVLIFASVKLLIVAY